MIKGTKYTQDFIVDLACYTGFISLFNDRNPLHTNKDFAETKGFSGPVMHGNILNGFLSFFIGECLPTKDVIIHSQQITYIKPVYLNDKLFFEAEVEEYYDSVKAVLFKFSFRTGDDRKVAKGKIQIGLI